MTHNSKRNSWQINLAIATISASVIGINIVDCLTKSAFAQSSTPSHIAPDTSSGNLGSQVIHNYNGQPTEAITGGKTSINNQNLFHSFRDFNVKEGRAALFLIDNNSIRNVFVRVVGDNPSNILGKLQTSTGSNANLFLINPHGIFFGPNSRVDIGGSFVASTATAINFADNSIFSTTSPQALLTVSVPVGLQFGTNPGNINVQGELNIGNRQTLALVGGNVTLDGGDIDFLKRKTLNAPVGQIAIGGIAGAGTVGLNLQNDNNINKPILNFSQNAILANIFLQNQATINVNGNGAGYIEIRGSQVGLTHASQVIANVEGSETGRGIFIQAQQLSLKDGSQLSANLSGQDSTGSGGDITIKSKDSVIITGIVPNGLNHAGNPSGLFTRTEGKGSGGNVTIETGKLIVADGGNISASSAGNDIRSVGGTITINAGDFVKVIGNSKNIAENSSSISAQTRGAGNGGSITITTPILFVQNSAFISASTGSTSTGNGGNITINSPNFIEISGKSPIKEFTSGLFSRSRGSGNAGSLSITTGKLIMRDQAEVTVAAMGTGNAGKLQIKAQEIRLDGGANLSASTSSGNGGDINLQIDKLLLLRRKSFISTTAGISGGGGDGGNINIDMPNGFIIAVPGENSNITANAFEGKGGSVNINATGVLGIEFREKENSLTNDITASSEFGLNGTVQIHTPEVQASQGLVNLPNQPVVSKLAQVCKVVAGRNQDTFTMTGRGGLPTNPTETLNAEAVMANWINVGNISQISHKSTTHQISTPIQSTIVEATGWVVNSQGEVVLTANTPIATVHKSWQSEASCAGS